AMQLVGIRTPDDVTEALGVRLGVSVSTVDEVQDLLFASLSGRVVPFDVGSFDRWRPQRVASAGSADAVFSGQLGTADVVPVSSSPIKGTSLGALVAQGAAWTISGADMVFHDPLQGLGLLVLSEVGLTVASVIRAHRETLAIAIKYRMRHRYGVPKD